MFKSCGQLWSFFHSFRSGKVDLEAFRHRQHLSVALCYAAVLPVGEAVSAFREDLLSNLCPLGLESKYSETITRFWIELAAHYLAQHGAERCLADVANAFAERFGDKGAIAQH
ncbi:MAG: hypothetical protein GIW99_03795 [Candidatus Eremiobacteraeota bacterium]|nr:hypothetical protein [Candidatus Eremiobacteraeota bacterium]MBC5826795.1 hypothetical protein [Candidatus Eremiobacteraeota bacterium]